MGNLISGGTEIACVLSASSWMCNSDRLFSTVVATDVILLLTASSFIESWEILSLS